MVLNKDCDNLDMSKMSRDYKYLGTIEGLIPVMGEKYYPYKEKGWIFDCPDDCECYKKE